MAQLIEHILEDVYLTRNKGHNFTIGVLRFVDEEQLSKVHGHKVLSHGQYEEFLP